MAEEAILKRVLPHSIEAEQSVIGSMIMDKDAIVTASEILHGDDFYSKQYGIIFDAMVELHDSAQPVDLITLQNKLKEKDVPPEVSSLEFVKDLLGIVPTSANVANYANIVAEKSLLRKLIRLNEEIENTCYAGKESLEFILEDTEKRVFDLVQRRNTGDFVPIRQVVLNAMDKIEQASKTTGTVTGIATGFIDLDYKTSHAAIRPCADRCPSFHGKDGVCSEYRTACGIQAEGNGCDLQSGNVKGTARQPSVLLRIPRGQPAYPKR